MKRLIQFLVRWYRLRHHKCPYCNTGLLTGLGGATIDSRNRIQACPGLHYAKETRPDGSARIYDEGGAVMQTGGDLA